MKDVVVTLDDKQLTNVEDYTIQILSPRWLRLELQPSKAGELSQTTTTVLSIKCDALGWQGVVKITPPSPGDQ